MGIFASKYSRFESELPDVSGKVFVITGKSKGCVDEKVCVRILSYRSSHRRFSLSDRHATPKSAVLLAFPTPTLLLQITTMCLIGSNSKNRDDFRNRIRRRRMRRQAQGRGSAAEPPVNEIGCLPGKTPGGRARRKIRRHRL